MHEFAEEYVANLAPRDERYDTRLGDDFYVATFPNGVKTWAYVYQVNGYTRRQTLGIYPEMPLPQALESLYAARRTRAVEAELADQGLDGTQMRQTEDSPINLTAKRVRPKFKLPMLPGRFLAGVATGAVVSLTAAVAVWWFLAPTPDVDVAGQVAVADLQPPVNDTVVNPSGAAIKPGGESPATAREQEPAVVVQSLPAPAVAAQTLPAPAAVAPPVASESAAPAKRPDAEAAELGASQQAVRQLQQDLTGTLAWAQLTSDVKDGEPIDELSWVVELDHAPRRIFYFVRVRGMAGRTVTYRWRHEGKLLKEDAVRVGQGWHSPAYSGMTLTQERLGHWQVEVLGPEGQPLGSEEFETRLTQDAAPRLSRR